MQQDKLKQHRDQAEGREDEEEAHPKKQPAEIVNSVFELLEEYSAGTASPDDLTMLVLRT